MRPIDRVRGEINQDFRSASEIAERLGLSVNAIGAPLGMLRRHGEVEYMLVPRGQSLWRKASGGDLHGSALRGRANSQGLSLARLRTASIS